MDFYQNINEWQNKVAKTSQKMYTLAENSLKNNPSLEKIIIVKQLPRYDNKVKADLADFANHILEQEWIKNGCNKKIVIAKQKIEDEANMKIEAFGDTRQPNYDGIHMRGGNAVPFMTRSFIKMLTDIYPDMKSRKNIQNLN